MVQGLNVNNVVQVVLNLAALAAGYQNFGTSVIMGSETFLDTRERIRRYNDLESVLADVGIGTPVANAATLHFSQVPQPQILYLARWAQFDTNGLLHGAILTPTQQALSNFTAITTGSMKISVDGTLRTLTAMDFSGATNLNGVASIVQAKLVTAGATGATVKWDGISYRFDVTSGTTGTSSAVSYGAAHTSGTDVSDLLGLTTGRAQVPLNGQLAETLAQAVAALADVSSEWYALTVATATPPTTLQHLSASALVEGMSRRRMYGITTQDTACLDQTRSDDVMSQAKALGYKRTVIQYSSWRPDAVVSFIGRAMTVNFNASNTMITLKFKEEPGVVAENLSQTQADAIDKKNGNVFVNYQNGTAIIQQGVMSAGNFFDEIHGTDWYVDYVQTNLYNTLRQSPTKVPQTDAGMNLLKNVMNRSAQQGVNNGLFAPGQWNLPGFGQLQQFDHLDLGYYTFAPPVDDQPQALREKRVSVPFQQACKGAGAVHKIDLAITFNR